MTAQPFPFSINTSISTGTLNPDHLIPVLIETLRAISPMDADEFGTMVGQDQAEVLADLVTALDESAPDTMFFGSHPDDGADLGFWSVGFLDD